MPGQPLARRPLPATAAYRLKVATRKFCGTCGKPTARITTENNRKLPATARYVSDIHEFLPPCRASEAGVAVPVGGSGLAPIPDRRLLVAVRRDGSEPRTASGKVPAPRGVAGSRKPGRTAVQRSGPASGSRSSGRCG